MKIKYKVIYKDSIYFGEILPALVVITQDKHTHLKRDFIFLDYDGYVLVFEKSQLEKI